MKKNALIFCVALIAFAGGLSVRGLLSSPKEITAQDNQRLLPDFSLSDLSGKPHLIKEWQNKVLIINFWATWCTPCLKEMPEFSQLQTEYADKGLQVIGIALDDAEPVKEFVNSKKITYPILLGDTQGTKIAHDLGNIVDTVPFTVFVNKDGHVIKTHMGTLDRAQLKAIVLPLLK